MKEPNKDEFIAVMVEEMEAQLKGNKTFSLILWSKVSEGATILPAVWQMKCKCWIQTHEGLPNRRHTSILIAHAKSRDATVMTPMLQ